MSTDLASPEQKTARLNWLSVVALILSVGALLGTWLNGFVVLAVFAVGAGHVSLSQMVKNGESGRVLAYIALAIAYALATYALIRTFILIPVFLQQS